jgi:hypothetical protein
MPFDAQLNSVQLLLKVFIQVYTLLLHENLFKVKRDCSVPRRVSITLIAADQ